MLKVLSICKTLPTPATPGAGVFVARRLEALRERVQLRVMQPVPYLPVVRPLPAWAHAPRQQGSLTIEPAPMLYIPGVLKRLDGRLLRRAVRRKFNTDDLASDFDLVDAHFGYPDGVGAVGLAMAANRPAFVTVRGLETDYLKMDGIHGQLVAALQAAAGCICVSYSLQDLLLSHGVSEAATRVIPNGMDRQMFAPGNRDQARSSVGVGPDVPLLVAVGTLINLKRHHVLIRAFSAVIAKNPHAELVIIGGERDEPGYLPSLRNLAAELGVANSVRFTGAIAPKALRDWLQAADLFALGTSREGCCNAVLEALSTGLPVVTTPAGDNARYVHDNVNGRIVPIDDARATAEAIQDVLAKRWDPDQISGSLNVGSWSAVAEAVVDFYRLRLQSWRGYSAVAGAGVA